MAEKSLPAQASADQAADERIVVPTKYVKCDGGGGPLGHPVSWMDMGEENHVTCKYCDREFVLAAGVEPHTGAQANTSMLEK